MLTFTRTIFAAIGSGFGSVLGSIFGFLMMAGLTVFILVSFYLINLMDELPEIERADEISLNVPLRIYTRDGKLTGEFGAERRIPVAIEDTPSVLHDAIISAEDDGFYNHSGVDFKAILRAVLSNLKSGGKGQGASTITMQVARNFFLSNEKTYERKVKEILLAFRLEKTLTKEQILELYLNKIFLGHRSYGFQAAAKTYYDRDLKELTLPELCMLAGLPKGPSAYNPIRNAKRALERRNYVLGRMHENGLIDDLAFETAKQSPVTAELHKAKVEYSAPYITELARQYVVKTFGDDAYKRGFEVTLTVNSNYQSSAQNAVRKGLMEYDERHGYRGPVKNVDLNAQVLQEEFSSLVEQALADVPSIAELMPAIVMESTRKDAVLTTKSGDQVALGLGSMKWAGKYYSAKGKGPTPTRVSSVVKKGDVVYLRPDPKNEGEWLFSQMPGVSGALVTLDPHSGAVLALMGGYDYYYSKFNRAVQARRQLGSNIKPFIYAAALEKELTPASLVSGGPIIIKNGNKGLWKPENYSKKFYGPTRLRKALKLSMNLVSVRLLRSVGIDYARDYIEGFGINKELLPPSLSLSLGTASVTPLQVASAYATLANGGKRVQPYLIHSITDQDGNYVAKPVQACDFCVIMPEDVRPFGNLDPQRLSERAMGKETHYLIVKMMQEVIKSGTAVRAKSLGRSDISGKTGTTNDFRDAWFSGFTPDVVTSVWIGFDRPSFLGRKESGAGSALPVWIDHMKNVLPDYPEKDFIQPPRVTSRFINKTSGNLTADSDPNGYWEYFKLGTEPSQRHYIAPPPPRVVTPVVNNDGSLVGSARAVAAPQVGRARPVTDKNTNGGHGFQPSQALGNTAPQLPVSKPSAPEPVNASEDLF